MNVNAISRKLRTFLNQALVFQYHKRVPKSVDLRIHNTRLKDQVLTLSGQVQISLTDSALDYSVYRLPQTRIYTKMAQNACARVDVVEFFKNTVMIIENFGVSSITAVVKSLKKEVIPESSTPILNDQIEIPPGESVLIWRLHNQKASPENLPAILSGWYESEKRKNPLYYLKTDNQNLNQRIDRLWAEIECLDENNHFADDVFSDKGNMAFWIQEILLYFGWNLEAEEALAGVRISPGSESKISIVKRRLQQFNTLISSKLAGATIDSSEHPSGRSLLERYMGSAAEPDQALRLDIVNFWKKINLPSRKRYVLELMENNPDEVIAFSLIALKSGFWWSGVLGEILIGLLPEVKHNRLWKIWHLLWLLNAHSVYHWTHDRILAECRSSESEFRVERPVFSITNTHHSHSWIYRFGFAEGYAISIDKEVQILYQPGKGKIFIRPALINAGEEGYAYQTITISCAGIEIEVPLVWTRFTIRFNDARFRFLKKKNRFQITVSDKSDQALQVSEVDTYDLSLGDRKKYYKTIRHTQPVTKIKLYHPYGGTISRFGSHIDRLYIKGYGFDRQGLLVNEFIVHRNRIRQGYRINANSFSLEPFNCSSKELDLRIQASRGEDIRIDLEAHSGLFYRFLTTRPELLEQQMMIMHHTLSPQALIELRESIYGQFYFYPQVIIHNKKMMRGDRYYFVIADLEAEHVLLERESFSLCSAKPNNGLIYFLIHPERAAHFFKHFYDILSDEF